MKDFLNVLFVIDSLDLFFYSINNNRIELTLGENSGAVLDRDADVPPEGLLLFGTTLICL